MSTDIQLTQDITQPQTLFEEKQSGEIAPIVQNLPPLQAVFSRHETFHPRFGWIKKGFDRTCQDGKVFLKDDAPTTTKSLLALVKLRKSH
jgi:hypothetical protein